MTQRIGVDLGGTKIEVAVLDGSTVTYRRRVPTPGTYQLVIDAVARLVWDAEAALAVRGTVGVGIPGTLSPASGLVKNANSQALIGHALDQDLSHLLDREVRVENDANLFALSEAADGAGAGHHCVFGVIIGTGCGGGIIVDGRVLAGRHRIAGEWGHTPLPWPRGSEYPQPACWCGQVGCLELYLSGTGLRADAGGVDPGRLPGLAAAGNGDAAAALERHVDRLARGLAVIMNILDPDIIVLGGGLSNMAHLYERLPALISRYVFSDVAGTPIVPAQHGDSSGVRGAAWLWPA